MKTLYKYFTKLSLVKQLILLLSVGGLLILLVMMPIVDMNLNSIIDSSMYETLKLEQDVIINNDDSVPFRGKKRVSHIIYDASTHTITATNVINEQELYLLYHNVFAKPVSKINNELTTLSIEGKSKTNIDTYYYVITRLENNEYLISIQNSDYSNELLSDIRNQTIYIIYAFFLFIAFVLVLWVLSLINPLKKIKKYIDDIKNRNQSNLTINREDEIGIVSSALVDMNDELLKQEKIKEEMIHNISHDLKTPIAIIKTYSESVKDDIYPYGDKNSSMDIILENADRLENKVKSLLYLNRLNYIDSSDQVFEDINMKELINKVISQMDLLNTNLMIETYLDDIIFVGSNEHFRIAIENLLDNAKRYAATKIIITLKENELEIYNDGSSIDEELLPYLFSPYVKGNKGQFGLGLSIVKKITSIYGYHVEAINKDEGCSFIIRKHII